MAVIPLHTREPRFADHIVEDSIPSPLQWKRVAEENSGLLETCCVCLEPLCTDAVTPLLAATGWAPEKVCCRHYCHFRCALRLQPQRCPVCRVAFDSLRRITREGFSSMTAAEVLAALESLHGAGRAATAALELVAAVYPITKTEAAECFALAGIQVGKYNDQFDLQFDSERGDSLAAESLARVMHHLNCCYASKPCCPRPLAYYTRISRASQARRRRLWRRFVAVNVGMGGAFCGLLVGAILGGILGFFFRNPAGCLDAKAAGRLGSNSVDVVGQFECTTSMRWVHVANRFVDSLSPSPVFTTAVFAVALAAAIGCGFILLVVLVAGTGRVAAFAIKPLHRLLWFWTAASLGVGITDAEVGRRLWLYITVTAAFLGALCGSSHAVFMLHRAGRPRGRLLIPLRSCPGSIVDAGCRAFCFGTQAGIQTCMGAWHRQDRAGGDGSLREELL
eukprot:TRINITY_DN20012_c0_g1_i1.p1 TRINITY_DN20012_c0_g1~~TRINITY_DN20012_c0_g1_i1.p1  ORF type:complete len:450 (-),score=37.46 TRINITY_DN20012_c0_g1_i1:260-1609(-)